MKLKTGKPRPLESISARDAIRYPIWMWSLGHEDDDAIDETWQEPVINSRDVIDEMIEPIITLKIVETNEVASGSYDVDASELYGISIWREDEWIILNHIKEPFPLTFIAVPTIKGVPNVKFVARSSGDEPLKPLPQPKV